MSSSAVLNPVQSDLAPGGAPSSYLGDEFWEYNPNANRHTADPAQIEECYRQKARTDAKYQAHLPQLVQWDLLEYRSALPHVVHEGSVFSDVSAKPVRRRKSLRDKLGWMLRLGRAKKGEAEPISLKLSDHEHFLLMNYGVVPFDADERKLSCEELGQVRSIRKGTTARRSATQVRRSYRRLGAA